MFDAKSLIEAIMKGGNPPAQQSQTGQGGVPDLSDLLRQFTQGGERGQPQSGGMQELPTRNAGQSNNDTGAERGSALDELMRQFSPGSSAPRTPAPATNDGASGGGALEDLLRQFTQGKAGHQNQAGSDNSTRGYERPGIAPDTGSGTGAGGSLGDLLGQVFGQAGQQSTDKTSQREPKDTMREILEKIGGSGAASGDMMRQLNDFISNNKVGAGAALGGLGALIFGTKTGRSVAMSAAKIGALAIIGGLAYKAYQNYSQGRPLVNGSIEPEAAPRGSGFEAETVSNDAAVTYIRGMISAAAADGRIDSNEQQQIVGALSNQGLDARAEEFLAKELNNPASIDELIDGVSNDTESLQLYTAARVSIEPDSSAEQQFLAILADRLGIAPDLRAHVDSAARGLV